MSIFCVNIERILPLDCKSNGAEGLVFRPEDYMYSSAVDYAEEKGLLGDVVVIKY